MDQIHQVNNIEMSVGQFYHLLIHGPSARQTLTNWLSRFRDQTVGKASESGHPIWAYYQNMAVTAWLDHNIDFRRYHLTIYIDRLCIADATSGQHTESGKREYKHLAKIDHPRWLQQYIQGVNNLNSANGFVSEIPRWVNGIECLKVLEQIPQED